MGTFRYGDPSSQTDKLLGARPPCWGTSKYDNEDRECRACGFQQTCRERISQSLREAPSPTPVSYFNQFVPQQSYATPQVVVRQAIPQVVQLKPTAPSAVPQVVSQPQGVQDRYGQFQDPMFGAVKSTPSIMRPQLPGENFSERVMKNMLLASAESALGELMLGVRQLIWAPKKKDE